MADLPTLLRLVTSKTSKTPDPRQTSPILRAFLDFSMDDPQASSFSLGVFLHWLSTTHMSASQSRDNLRIESRLNYVGIVTSLVSRIVQMIEENDHLPSEPFLSDARTVAFRPELNADAIEINLALQNFLEHQEPDLRVDEVAWNLGADSFFLAFEPQTLPPVTPPKEEQSEPSGTAEIRRPPLR